MALCQSVDPLKNKNYFVLFVGLGLSGYWLTRTMNTVRRVVLRKGGRYVTIVTYGVLGFTSRHTTKPVSQVSVFNQDIIRRSQYKTYNFSTKGR